MQPDHRMIPARTEPVGPSDPADPGGRHQRRERELSSLYATARALTALDEVDTVLASIVRHAHDLLGADVTYLSVFDHPHAELILRAVEGSLSPAFRSAQVPADTGVGGRVVETGAPFWVSNYLTDPSLKHDPGFDSALASEGIVALLGVPLRDGERVFGILYAADRVERPFEMEEVALLSAFADHAAVALQNARLYEESQRALAELREAYATIERSAQVHEDLTRVVLTGGGAREIADLLVGALGGRVAIYDRDDHLLVTTANVRGRADSPTDGLREPLAESRRTGRCAVGGDAREFHTVVAILAGDSYLGAVVLSREGAPSEVEQRTLERGTQILGLLTLKQNAVVEAEERVRGELLTEVITSVRPYSGELMARAESRHLSVDTFNALLVVDSAHLRPADLARRLHSLAEGESLAGVHLGAATMLVRTDDLDRAATVVHRRLRAMLRTPVLVCATPVSVMQASMQRSFTLASRCARLLRSVGVTDRATSTTHWGMYAMLFDPERGDDLHTFVADALGELLDYDARRGTDLVGTVAAYFDNSTNLTRTAKALHVHMNTLIKRLERVSALIGDDWQSAQRALPLQLAVRLHLLATDLDRGETH
ncbi:helix-turn-helix domain-containing protein [Gordonia paraffinivorans]|uniref:helix-turn-helix domain-containing protein n=1 Tax=Gordonia paraffinivorans TaxID=175628 RepID=UPI001C92D2A3|nr:GAF domain-containing protein [Gordonia paraffinivorans]